MEKFYRQLAVFQTLLLVNTLRGSPAPLEALYIPGLSEGMVKSGNLLGLVVRELFYWEKAVITFNGSDGEDFKTKTPRKGWPGKDWYIRELTNRGVSEKNLLPTRPAFHTRDEADALVELACEKKWKRVGITTIPYHYPRFIACLVQAMKEGGYWLSAYAVPPTKIDWWHSMKSSQGNNDTTPFDEMPKDFERLLEYQKRGWAACFPDIFVSYGEIGLSLA